MRVSRPLAIIASLAVVAGLGSLVLYQSTVRTPRSKEEIVHFKMLCSENMPGVRRAPHVLYGPSCLPSFVWN